MGLIRFSEVETPWLKEARRQQIVAEKAVAEAMRQHELRTEKERLRAQLANRQNVST